MQIPRLILLKYGGGPAVCTHQRCRAKSGMGVAKGRSVVVWLFKRCCSSWTFCTLALIVGECLIVTFIVARVTYTEIDYVTYQEQARAVMHGERHYASIEGPQGPLVYPAGHVWLYVAVSHFSNDSVATAQRLFGGLYVLDVLVVAYVYATTYPKKSEFPPVFLATLAVSRCSPRGILGKRLAAPPRGVAVPSHRRMLLGHRS